MGPKTPSAPAKGGGTPAGLPKDASLDNVKKLIDEKKFAEALEMADGLLAKEPGNADLHAWKGHARGSLAQGNPVNMIKYGMGAMQEYETALKLDPQNAEGHFGRGSAGTPAPHFRGVRVCLMRTSSSARWRENASLPASVGRQTVNGIFPLYVFSISR